MKEIFSYLHVLECADCGRKYAIGKVQTFCTQCQAPLLARYELDSIRKYLDRDQVRFRNSGMWRWHELLPVKDPQFMVYLGEGDTPLLKLNKLGDELGLTQLYIKDESLNPTGSFKARGLSVAVSKAKELGITKIIIPTAGNAGGALAAYAARAGLEACIFMPKDTPMANIEESRFAGATVILIDGLINAAAVMASEKARTEGWFDLSTFKEPYRLEGKKIMGYELAESFNWELPDVIVYPTGGGIGLIAMWKAFDELEQLGWLTNKARPRMVAVQAEGCAPFVKSFNIGKPTCDIWSDARTIATGLRVPKSYADQIVLGTIYQSKGIAVSVSDHEIIRSQHKLAFTEGIFASPEGAATYAGLEKLIERGWLQKEERIVLFNTCTGLKYLQYKP